VGCLSVLGHDANGLPGQQLLSDNGVDPSETRKKTMISLAMIDDQERPISSERPGKHHFAAERSYNLGTVRRLETDSLCPTGAFAGTEGDGEASYYRGNQPPAGG
jgi:hypothetical protein